jgi:hypothetical protein
MQFLKEAIESLEANQISPHAAKKKITLEYNLHFQGKREMYSINEDDSRNPSRDQQKPLLFSNLKRHNLFGMS